MDETHRDDQQIRLLLVDERLLFRATLARFLCSEPDLTIVGESDCPADALKVLEGSPVDVVLLDVGLGFQRGHEFIPAAHQAGFKGHFLLLADSEDAQSAALALKSGASGIFLKSQSPERLVRAIRLVASGEVWVDPKVIHLLAEQLEDRYPCLDSSDETVALEDRERNVLFGILGGLTNKKIGENMGLSESAVKNIVQRLFGKTGVKKRSQLVRLALEHQRSAASFVAAGPLAVRR